MNQHQTVRTNQHTRRLLDLIPGSLLHTLLFVLFLHSVGVPKTTFNFQLHFSTSIMEQILALFDTSKAHLSSSVVIQLVQRATSHKSIFGFAEFYEPLRSRQRELPADTLNSSANLWIDILEIFTYGTWADLCELSAKHLSNRTEDKAAFPELNQAQIKKIKQLTLLTLASQKESLEYDELKDALRPTLEHRDLEMQGTEQKDELEGEIEPLIIDTIYSDLLDARLDSRGRTIEVKWAAGRDVSPERLEEITSILANWDEMALRMLRQTQESIEAAKGIVNSEGKKPEIVQSRKISVSTGGH